MNPDIVIAKKGELNNAWMISDLKHILMPLKMTSDGAIPSKILALILMYIRLKDEGWEHVQFHLVVNTDVDVVNEDDVVINEDNDSDVDESLVEVEV